MASREKTAASLGVCALLALATFASAAANQPSDVDKGSIVAWGWNKVSQCDVPPPNTDFVAVAAGNLHSLGLKGDGSIVAWGDNYAGQCDVPVPNTDFVAVAAGVFHSLGLTADGSIVAWGCGDPLNYGQCDVPAPNTDFVAVAAGGQYSLGVKADGSILAWGCRDWDHGQCNVPVPNTDFVAVAGGDSHSLGLKADGSVVAWGYNGRGQCDVPAPNTDFVAVAAGGAHSLGLKADGSIVAWGWNRRGQCNVPAPNTDFVAVAAGGYHSLGLKADGSIVAWGYNYCGQCDVRAPNTGFIAVAAGALHSLGVRGPVCGDGVVDDGEECDDGGESPTCDADCTVPECGDGTLNVTASEECEPPGSDCCDDLCHFEPDGTPCTDDGDMCNGVEVCDGRGNCVGQPVADCNENGVEDSCDIEDGTSQDCNTNTIPDECDIADGTSADDNDNGIPDECETGVHLDIRPGKCPNRMKLRSRGPVPIAVVGCNTFDVAQIDRQSLALVRADGIGGSVRPLTRPHGHAIRIKDVATPFQGSLCDCHKRKRDGIDDLLLKFSTQDMVAAFQLDSLARGMSLVLSLSGQLADGTRFHASDCIVSPGRSIIPTSRRGLLGRRKP